MPTRERERERNEIDRNRGPRKHDTLYGGGSGVRKERTTIHGSFAAHNANTRVPHDCTRFWKPGFRSIVTVKWWDALDIIPRANKWGRGGERKVAATLRRPLGRRII